jgi:hypothetical protein
MRIQESAETACLPFSQEVAEALLCDLWIGQVTNQPGMC